MAGSLGNLGDVFRYQENYDKALEVLEQSLGIWRELRDIHGMAITLGSIACAYLEKGEAGQAQAAFRSSLMMSRNVGGKTMIATNLDGIANLLSMSARHATAPEEEARLAFWLLSAADRLRKITGAPRSTAEQVAVDRVFEQINHFQPKDEIESELQPGESLTVEQAIEDASHYLSKFAKVEDAGQGYIVL